MKERIPMGMRREGRKKKGGRKKKKKLSERRQEEGKWQEIIEMEKYKKRE